MLAPDKQYCKWLLRYVTIVRFFKVWEGQQTQIIKTIYLCDNAQSAVRLELAQIDCVSSFRFLLQNSSCKNQTPHAESSQMLCPSKARALEGSKFLIPKHWGKIFLQTKLLKVPLTLLWKDGGQVCFPAKRVNRSWIPNIMLASLTWHRNEWIPCEHNKRPKINSW